MAGAERHDGRLARLPREPIDRVTGPLARFLRIGTAGAGALLLAVAVALALANLPGARGALALWETPLGLRAGPSSSCGPSAAGSTTG